MRYEDASHTGAFQGSQPVANDDLDSLAAGSRSAATGNLISGEGTQTGSAGADIAVGAHITAIAGKSGEDTSFSSGKLSVSGEHGKLSVDADGNYIYQANAGVENVRDRFTYTLADNEGATDTASLIVEIGKTPVVIKANAQQIVPGPDGVVTLPPGVELSDVHVVGRNLVIDMPDGTQMIIIDGAIFVPQLVLDGVEVPSTNLAALLIGQEPQPAAGEAPQSSGGNFDVPVPPLDPGVPLGDLIPPTEYDYTPPEPQEVDDILDREPEIFIQPDGQPATVAAVDSVDEDGLPTRNGGEPEGSDEGADGNPSNNSDPDEATSGFIVYDSPDGVDSITINGVVVSSVGQVINGAYGTLIITSIADGQIGYSYTLTDNTSGDTTHDDFAVVLTDDDGDTASATLTINIIDDVPTARNDTDAVPDGADSTDGNVLTGAGTTSGIAGHDTPGADDIPNGVTGIHAGTSGSFTAVSAAGVSVVGTFGNLEIHSDGSYTYTLSGDQGAGGTDVFTYQIIDGDGDVSTATLTIAVPPDFIPEPNNATAIVDDDGLPNGNNDSAPGDDVVPNTDGDNNETTFSGTLTADFGSDGPGTFTLAAMNGQAQVVGQETVRYSWNDATDTLTAVVEGGARDGLTLFTVELNPNGQFDVTLVNNVLQVDDGTNTENNASAALTFTATDSDGDSTNGTLTISFDDDIPTAIVPPPPPEGEPRPLVGGAVDEDALPDGNNDSAPGDDPGGTTTSGGAGSLGALFNAGADQPLTFGLGSNTSGLPSLTSNGVAVTYAVVGDVLTASAGGATVFTLTVNADGSWTFELEGQLDHPTSGTEDNLLLDLSSIVVATDSDGDEVSGAPGAFVIDVDDDLPVPADANPIVGLVDEDDLPTGNHDDAPGDDDPNNVDGDNDGTTTGGGAPSLASLFNAGADQPLSILLSADTSGLPALTSNGVPVTYAVVGNVLTASAGGSTVFTLTVNADGTWEFDLQDQLDHSVPGTEDNLLIDFSSVITAVDADGDTAGLPDDMFVIDVDDDMPQEFEECPDDVITVNDVGATFTGDLNLPPVGADEPGIVSFGVENGDPVLDNGGEPVTSGGQPLFYFVNAEGVLEARAGDATGDVIFTITINGDGTFTYDQFGPMGSGGEISFNDLTSTSAGNVEFRGVGADDPATTVDLLLSAEGGGADATVNTDSDSIGSANQSMDAGETVRIDLVSDLTTGAATPSGFGYSGHISTSSFIGLIPQVQGSQSETAAFTVWALNTSNTQANEPDRDPAGGFSDSTVTPVTEVTVKDYLSGESTSVDVTGFAVGVFTPVAYGISARVNADGSVTFSGIQQGDSYGFSTGAGEFNAVAVQSEPAGTGGSTQDSFDLGVFSIGADVVVEPIDLTVPIVLTDSDGDPVVCDIDIILGPPLDAPDITVTVNEAGLPLIGSDAASDSEIQPGDLQGQVTGGTGPYTFTLVGSGDGAFGTLVLNPDGTFTYTLDTPFDTQPDANDGANPELGAESFTFEATDSLGVTQTGTITVNIIDDVPSIDVTVGADADVNLVTQDAETIAGATDTAASSADFSGVFGLTFVAGADGAAATPDLNYVLGVSAPGVDSGLNQGGANIYLHLIGGKVVGSTSNDVNLVNAGNTVFDVSVSATGVVTLTQYSQIDHPLQAGLNDAPFADQVIALTDSHVTLTASASIVDNDGDTADDSETVNIGANLQFADHGPTATNDVDTIAPGFFGTATGNVLTGTEVLVPEDANGTDGNADNVGADTPGSITLIASNNVPANTDNVADGAGNFVVSGQYGVLTINANGDYSYDRNDGSAGGVSDVFTYTLTDADGDTVTATLTINIGINPPVATTGSAAVDDDGLGGANPAGTNDIDANTFPAVDDLDGPASSEASFTGQLGVTGGDGDIDFNLIAPAGQVAVGQEMVTFAYVAGVLTATIATSPDAGRVGDPLFTVTLNEETGQYTVNLLDNVLHGNDANDDEDGSEVSVAISYQVTDAGLNNSAAPGTLTIVFNDDVPSASVSTQFPTDQLTLDESPAGEDQGGDSDPSGIAEVTSDFSNNFAAVTVFGADGAAASNGVVYSLALAEDGIGSGLYAIDNSDIDGGDGDGYGQGDEILLSQSGNIITGSVGGTDYFTIEINPATGVVTFTQLVNVWHADTANDDDTSTLTTALASDLQVVQTVTDADGDTASASINLGAGVFHIEDDGPQAIQPDSATLENEAGATATADLDDDSEVITDFGTDGEGLVQFANIANGDDSGYTSDGDAIEYFLSNDGQTLQGRTNSSNGVDGELVFTVQINQGSGDYTVTMAGTIDNGSGVSFDDLTSSAAGNVNFRGVGENDPGTAVDLLLSASATGGGATSVNTDSDSIGAANQSMDVGESLRIDFVSNLTTGAATPTGFGYSGHVDTNSYLQTIPQVQGNQAQVVSFKVWALDTSLAQSAEPDRNPAGGFSDSTAVFITQATIIDYNGGGTHTEDISGLADGATEVLAFGVSVTRNSDGSVTFSGVQEGDQYGVATGANDFNAVVVQDTSGSFDLGVFSIGQVDTGEPVDLSFDLKITDADGDTVTMTDAINVTLNPAADSLAATSFSAQTEQLQKVAANSNTLTLAAAVAAAGMVETQAAAAPAHDNGKDGHQVEETSSGPNHQVAADASADNDSSISAVSVPEAANDSAPVESSSHGSGPAHSEHVLDHSAAKADAQSSSIPVANDQGPASSPAADASPAALAVGMPSAEALQAAGLTGNAQHGGSVEQIVADALGQGNAPAAVDAILDALPGGNGAVAALAHVASPAANSVPGGDMSMHGAFGHGADMMMNMHAAMQHHDAVQPVVNG